MKQLRAMLASKLGDATDYGHVFDTIDALIGDIAETHEQGPRQMRIVMKHTCM
jgi:hypothetical protein